MSLRITVRMGVYVGALFVLQGATELRAQTGMIALVGPIASTGDLKVRSDVTMRADLDVEVSGPALGPRVRLRPTISYQRLSSSTGANGALLGLGLRREWPLPFGVASRLAFVQTGADLHLLSRNTCDVVYASNAAVPSGRCDDWATRTSLTAGVGVDATLGSRQVRTLIRAAWIPTMGAFVPLTIGMSF